MTAYKTLKGKKIKFLASDPPAAASEGQVWYNGIDYKTSVKVEAWAAGGNLPAAGQSAAGFGTQTAAVSAGGTPPGSFGLKTFEYDGSSWTAGNNMVRATGSPYTSAYGSGSGTLTAGWAAGGGYPTANNLVENYDGTNWTASAVIPATRGGGISNGPQTAGLYFGGTTGAPPRTALVNSFHYDGEAWTGGGSLNTARTNAGGSGVTGSQTAALCFAGNTPGQTNKTEEYDGTSWSEVTNFPRTASYVGYSGSQTDALAFSGYTDPGNAAVTTTGYDGTSWSSRPNMAAGRLFYHSNSGTANNALAWSGEGLSNSTEEFSGTATLKVITDS